MEKWQMTSAFVIHHLPLPSDRRDNDVVNRLRAFVAVARLDCVEPLVSEVVLEELDRRREIPCRVDPGVHGSGGHREEHLEALMQLFLVLRGSAAHIDVGVGARRREDFQQQRPDLG